MKRIITKSLRLFRLSSRDFHDSAQARAHARRASIRHAEIHMLSMRW